MFNTYFVYILASGRNGTLYIGVTSDITRRVWENKAKEVRGFTAKYGVDRLMWFEEHSDIGEAIWRETKLKKWKRAWKIELFRDSNPNWDDLYPALTKGIW